MCIPMSPLEPGLYIVATPIGNLGDLSPRAADILSRADVIAVEDSRVTAGLLRHIGAKRPMVPYHDHYAEGVRPGLIARMAYGGGGFGVGCGHAADLRPRLQAGPRRARGRPCGGDDPGRGREWRPDAAGLPTDASCSGLPAPKEKARADAIAEVAAVRATLVLYESGPRLGACLATLAAVLGDARRP